MKILNVITLLTIIVFHSCKATSQFQKHKKIGTDALEAISQSDTIKIYNLIDTSSFFRVRGKEAFFDVLNQINQRIHKCGSVIPDSSIKINHDTLNNVIEYTYQFCRDINGNITNDSFDVIFTFALYDDSSRVHYIDMTSYEKKIFKPVSLPSIKGD